MAAAPLDRLKALIEADPKAAQKLLASLNEKLLVPHDGGQRDVYNCQRRFQVLDAGRRWGKTKVGAAKAVRRARSKPNQMVWWVAPTYKVVKRGYREVLRQLPTDLLAAPAPSDSSFDGGRSVVLRFKNGSRMEFYSAERPEGMLGEGVDFAILDEAAIMPKSIWEQIVRPTLMDRQGGALLISTPRGRNWFYQMYLRGKDPAQTDYVSWQFPSATNPHLEPGEIEEMEASLPRIIFEQEVLAEFVSKASSVFRFDDDAIQPLVQPQGHVVFGVDLAKSNDFTVIIGANENSRRDCYFERFTDVSWRAQRERIHAAARSVLRRGASSVSFMVDSTGVGDPVVEELQAEGLDVEGLNFTTWKQKMVMRYGGDLEHGRAFVPPEHVDEFEDYAMTITESGKFKYAAPAGQHDDVVSAKLLQHWGLAAEGSPQVTVITADEPVGTEDEEWDWGDYFFEDDEGAPVSGETVVLVPDSPAEIMARPDAWL